MSATQPFMETRRLGILIGVGIVAFACSLYLMLFADSTESATQDTFSHSAVGHAALVETLQRLDIPVSVSRFKTLEKAGDSTLLVLAEPDGTPGSLDLVRQARGEHNVLLVLPKWVALPHPRRRDWIGDVRFAETDRIDAIFDKLEIEASIFRGTSFTASVNRIGEAPTLNQPQLLLSRDLAPLIAGTDGILLGEYAIDANTHIWILSDPDLIANGGIGKGSNAALVAAIIRSHLPKGGSVMIDETIHGFEQAPDMLRTAFEPPFITVSIAFALAALAAILAGISRLGAPRRDAAALAAGRETLLGNVAGLLDYAEGGQAIVARYPQLAIAEVAQKLRAPADLDEKGLIAWLDRRGQRLGLSLSASQLVAESRLMAGRIDINRAAAMLGERVHQWKREILNEPRHRALD